MAAPSLLPEHERWARAFRVWRNLCNHSWYPQSDETHLLLLQILHLLLKSNRISHNLERTNWKCMIITSAEEWVSVLFNQTHFHWTTVKDSLVQLCDCSYGVQSQLHEKQSGFFLQANIFFSLLLYCSLHPIP